MIISVHIPKTGGQTFTTLLTSAFGTDCHFDYGAGPTKKPYWLEYWAAYRQRFSKIQPPPNTRCIQGHFLANKYAYFPGAVFATWVRDPLQLLPSLYFYWKRTPEVARAHPLCRRLHEENLSLEQFAAIPRFWNLQSKYLAGFSLERFAFIGITEHYERSIELFKKIFQLPEEAGYRPQNVNPEKREPYELAPELAARMRRWHRRDVALYARACERFERLCQQQGVA